VALPYIVVGFGLYVAHSALLAMLAYQAVMLAFVVRYRPTDPGRTGDRGGLYRWLPAALVALSVLVGVPLRLLWGWFTSGPALVAQLQDWGLTTANWWLFAAWLCLMNPWLEQRFWRGVLGSADHRPRATDAGFAGYHLLVVLPVVAWPWLAATFAALVAASWWWRQVIRLQGNFRGATIAHFLADASIMVALGLVYGDIAG
jgi:hypothetical protein